MAGPSEPAGARGPGRESYAKALGGLGSVLAALALLGVVVATGPPATRPKPTPPPAPAVAAGREAQPAPAPAPAEAPAPVPVAPEPPSPDREAVARGEQSLDAASRDRERAEARAESAARALAAASRQAADDARAAKRLAFRVRDPSVRVSQAAAHGGFLRAERDRLKGEVAALATAPRPKAKVLSNKNPVARPSDGDESHFEVRRNRVSYIDLERLLALVKADAMLRIKLSEGARVVDSRVGPVGAFSLEYSLARSLAGSIDDLLERRRISFDLRSWEVVPEFEGRGEPYEATRTPVSDYARAVNRLNPQKATITLWVYPDSFPMFRRLRDDLQARGFLVAARPLPEGMSIRGSPSGSLSAGQ